MATPVQWPDAVFADRAQPLAESILALVTAGPRWRHRRVETVEPISATRARRRVSVDFTVPAALWEGLALPTQHPGGTIHTEYVVPLGWLARRQLVRFDLRDAAGRALPMLLGGQIATVTRDLLLLAGLEAGFDTDDPGPTNELVDIAVGASREHPITEADAITLERRAARLGLRPEFARLVATSARGFLMLVVMPQIEGRRVVKWQTDELRRVPTSGVERARIDTGVPGINESASTHVELHLPDALRAESFALRDRRDRRDGSPPFTVALPERAPSASTEQPRLLLGPAPQAQDPVVSADLVVTPGGFLSPALVLSLLAVAILVVGLASHVEHVHSNESSTAPSILLGAFSVGFGLFLRTEEHQLVRAILSPARDALGALAAALALAALPVAFHLPKCWILGAWWGALVVSLASAFVVLTAIMNHTAWGRTHG